ncbi:hypothetical protein BJX70DRAFT_357477 [Aspergillus crustosus]
MAFQPFNYDDLFHNDTNKPVWAEIDELYKLLRAAHIPQNPLQFDIGTIPVSFYYDSPGAMSNIPPLADIARAVRRALGSTIDFDGMELPFFVTAKEVPVSEEYSNGTSEVKGTRLDINVLVAFKADKTSMQRRWLIF